MIENQKSLWGPDGTLQSTGAPQWLQDENLQMLMVAFEDEGFEIYAVGGCVRDSVLGRHVSDVDLSTNARPDDTIRIIESLMFHGKPWKAVPTGIEHGTISAFRPGSSKGWEITTFRADVETDGRHATVAFSDSVEQDAIRRDFTINAFYADRDGHVLDVVGGSADLKAGRVRFIGDPVQRIEEDHLRILRFFRFTATHGARDEGIDAEGLAGCAVLAESLAKVSRERIGAEMAKILSCPDPAPIVGTMEQAGIFTHILPGASALTLARLVDLEFNFPHEGRSLGQINLATRIAALGVEDVADRLRLSKKESRKIELVKREAGSTTPAHELGYRHGYWDAVHCLLLRWASLLQPIDEKALAAIARGAQAKFPVASRDLFPALEGKALGDRLNALEAAWIRSDFSLSKPQLLALP